MKLQAGVSELEAGRLRVGMPVRVTAQARPGDVFEGRLAAIAPEVDARNRHFAIEVRVTNPAGVLLSGMYGTAAIPLERADDVVAVPRDAVTTRNGARVTLKIDNDTIREVFQPPLPAEELAPPTATPAEKMALLEKALDRYRAVIEFQQRQLQGEEQQRAAQDEQLKSLRQEVETLRRQLIAPPKAP